MAHEVALLSMSAYVFIHNWIRDSNYIQPAWFCCYKFFVFSWVFMNFAAISQKCLLRLPISKIGSVFERSACFSNTMLDFFWLGVANKSTNDTDLICNLVFILSTSQQDHVFEKTITLTDQSVKIFYTNFKGQSKHFESEL